MLKNDVHLLQIKLKDQEDTIKLMEREIQDLNREHINEMDQIKKELTCSQSLINHYKGNVLFLIN